MTNILRAVLQEGWGLFVDDGLYAASILIWVGVGAFILPRLGLPEALPPLLLFVGLAAILVESAWRQARRSRG
jgi:hypothetical protein